jgi:hypothetical protein
MTTFACCRFSGKRAQGAGMHPSRVWRELYFRVRVNVTSGEKIKVAASRMLTYSPAKAVKELLNS